MPTKPNEIRKIYMQKTIDALKEMPLWLLWKKQSRNGKVSKIPFAADGSACGTNDEYQHKWVAFDAAQEAADKRKADGIGFVIPEGMFFLDIDHRDLNDPEVKEILALFNSYSEFSVSGTGIHVYGLCDVEQLPTWMDPKDGKRKLAKEYYTHHSDNGLELYFGDLTSRFAVYTGKTIKNQPLADCMDALLYTLNRYMKRPVSKSPLEKKWTKSFRNFVARKTASNSAVFSMTASGRNTARNQKSTW